MGNPAAYSVSKGGLIQLTRWLATVMAPQVRVNAISPGGILRGQPDVFVQRYKERTPLRRFATETDVAEAAFFLRERWQTISLVKYLTLMVDGVLGRSGNAMKRQQYEVVADQQQSSEDVR